MVYLSQFPISARYCYVFWLLAFNLLAGLIFKI